VANVRDILLNIAGDSKGGEAALERTAAGLEGIDKTEAVATVKIAREQFEREVAEVNAQLDEIGRRKVSATVRVKNDRVKSDLERVAADASAAFNRYFGAQGRNEKGMFSGLLRDAGRLASDLTPALGSLEGVSGAADDLEKSVGSAGFSLKSLASSTRDLGQTGQVLAVIIVASMVPAILALGGSLIAAVGGAGALATAFVGALIPAALGAIATFQRFSAILNVAKELQTKTTKSAYTAQQADAAAAAAADQRHAAMIGLRDATQAVTKANENYADAVKQAEADIATAKAKVGTAETKLGDTIRAGERQAVDAAERVVAAQADIKAAVTDAYNKWLDLIDAVKHDQLDLEGAQLGVLDAQDALNDAQAGYNSLLNQIPADKLGDILQKLNDVNLPEDQVKSFITSAMGADANPAFADQLYKASLKLRHAQYDLKVANQALDDSTKQLGKDQGDLNNLQTNGVAGYQPYIDAVKALNAARRDENRVLADNTRSNHAAAEEVRAAKKAYAELAKEGTAGNHAVKAALDAVTGAEQRLAEARRNSKRAADGSAISADKMSSASAKLKHDLDALSPAERDVLYALVGHDGNGGLKGAFRAAFGTDAVMHALAGGIRGITGLLHTLSPELHSLSKTFATVLGGIAKAATGKGARDLFRDMIILAQVLTVVGAKALGSFANALINIAKAATPGLVRVFLDFAGAMKRFQDATATPGAAKAIGVMIASFRTWASMMSKVVGMFGRLALVAAPFGNGLVKALGEGADHLGKWASSAKGTKQIGDFFRDTLPLASSIAKLLGQIVVFALDFIQFIAPVVKPFIDGLTTTLKVLNWIIQSLTKVFPRPVRELVGAIAAMVIGGPKLLGFLGKVPGILGDIAKFIGALDIANTLISLLDDTAGAVASAAVAVGKAIADGVSKGVSDALKLGGSLLDLGKQLIGSIVDGVQSAPAAIATAAQGVINAFGGALAAKLGGFSKVGELIVSGIMAGVTAAGKGTISLGKLGANLASAVGHAVAEAAKGVGRYGASIARAVVGGIKSFFAASASVARSLGNWTVGIVSALAHGVSTIGKRALSVGKSIGANIIRGIRAGAATLGRIGSTIADAVKAALNAAFNVAKIGYNIGKNIAAGIGKGIIDALKGIVGLPKKALDTLTHALHGIPGLETGGRVLRAGMQLVGEKGPELLDLPIGAEVIPNMRLPTFMPQAVSIHSSATMRSRPPKNALAAVGVGGGGVTEDHLHVHGHTQVVDPDPRTTMALLEARRRKRGQG
jgi:phage-related protein